MGLFCRLTSNYSFNRIRGIVGGVGRGLAGEAVGIGRGIAGAAVRGGRGAAAWYRGGGPARMGAGMRADLGMVGRGLARAGRAATWPYRGSFERGAVFTAGVGAAVGGYYGGRALSRRFGTRDRDIAMRAYTTSSPRGRKAVNYINRNFGGV